jgi:Na+/melibiose symporter-like transporter
MPASSRGRRGPVDLAGAALLAGVLAPFAWAMALGGQALPWASPAMAALLGASVACAVGLVRVERGYHQPIFPPAVLASRPLLLVLAVTVCFNAVGSAGEFLPAFAQSVLGTSAAVSGLLALPGLVVAAVGSSLLGRRLAARRRYRGVVLSWAAALVAVTAVYATFSPETALAWVFGAAGVMGLAQTATQVVPYTYPMLALKPEQVPSGIAVMTFAGSAANTVGAGLLTAAANTSLANVFRVPIVFGLLALAAALAFRDPKRP